jgi:hypothetical protein
MKTLDWSVETLGLDYNSTGLCNHLFKPEYIHYTFVYIYIYIYTYLETTNMTKRSSGMTIIITGGLYVDNFVMYKLIRVDLNAGNEW